MVDILNVKTFIFIQGQDNQNNFLTDEVWFYTYLGRINTIMGMKESAYKRITQHNFTYSSTKTKRNENKNFTYISDDLNDRWRYGPETFINISLCS